MEEYKDRLTAAAKTLLAENNRGEYTIPATGLYPHQWLWDSCFISIGLRHYDLERAKNEILRIFSGQWHNGMVPHMIFAGGRNYHRDREIWQSRLSPHAPDHVSTSGLTQPPVLAEAIVQLGRKMSVTERRSWYQAIFPGLLRYHQWLYRERDPHGEGLVLCIHPYETGLDNTPPWISELKQHHMPVWITLIDRLQLVPLVNKIRRDTRHVPPGQRMSSTEAMAYFTALRRLRRKNWDTNSILNHALFSIEDLTFNCILIRANHHLRYIAKTIKHEIPEPLHHSMTKADSALDQLWDSFDKQYFSRNYNSHKLISEFSIAAIMPLYAGSVSKERAQQIRDMLVSPKAFWLKYPVPTVPHNSHYFDPFKYWQGPVWLNTNWLIIDGLKRYGFTEEAEHIRDSSLALVAKHGFYEYFNPLTGKPAGAPGFSWTAALALDMLYSK